MKIYQVYKNLNLEIQEIECVKKTDSHYWTTNTDRLPLQNLFVKSFNNKQEAVKFLQELLISNIKQNEEYLKSSKEHLYKFNEIYNL